MRERGADPMRVELDKKSIFALASDTRMEILKTLQPMRRTVTQLSEALNIDKGAVHRHLKKMEEGGLVKRYEDHGFVYYGLTWKARDLVVPNESTRIVIVLSAVWILSLAIVFFVSAGLLAEGGDDDLIDIVPGYHEAADAVSDSSAEVEQQLYWVVPVSILGAVLVALCVMAYKMLRIPLQEHPDRAVGVESADDSDD